VTARRPGRAGPRRAGGVRLAPVLLRPGLAQFGRRVLDPGLSWELQRRRFDQVTSAALLPRGTTITETTLSGVRTEVVSARGRPDRRTVVHFHGGGYCIGSALMARGWAARLSGQAGCRVLLPEYRLAPEHPFPAALDDARAIVTALLGQPGAGPVVVSGDSAGAGLALSAVLARRDAGEPPPAGCILLSPWIDLGAHRLASPGQVRRDVLLSPGWLEACASAYTPPSQWADPAVSPLHAWHGGLPPLLIQAGSDELIAPAAGQLAGRASAAGTQVSYTRFPRMWHDFGLQPGVVAAADSALAQAAWFVRAVTRTSAAAG
jgi:acetyl esterase/lipase